MRTQPIQLGSIHPTQPFMLSVDSELKIKNGLPRKKTVASGTGRSGESENLSP
jgi:hypothetical protein